MPCFAIAAKTGSGSAGELWLWVKDGSKLRVVFYSLSPVVLCLLVKELGNIILRVGVGIVQLLLDISGQFRVVIDSLVSGIISHQGKELGKLSIMGGIAFCVLQVIMTVLVHYDSRNVSITIIGT